MISEHYPLRSTRDNLRFLFKSFGKQGIIFKLVVFEDEGKGRYNLAFGDVVDGELNDEVISNNFDILKTVSTVAQAVYRFFDNYPDAVLEINAVDEKRLRLYNRILSRRYPEIIENFDLYGFVDDKREPFQANKLYKKFEVRLKIS